MKANTILPCCSECGNTDHFTAILGFVDFKLLRQDNEYVVIDWAHPEVRAIYCDLCNSKLADSVADDIQEGISVHFSDTDK